MPIKRTLTEKNLAAHRANARKSRGPVTTPGRERQRDSSLRHGFYCQDDDKVLRALGEDPRELADLKASVHEQFPPAGGFDEALGMCLVKALWRYRRADRALDGLALSKAREAGRWRENRLHTKILHLKIIADNLRNLAHSVAAPGYTTRPDDYDLMDNLRHEESLVPIGDFMLALFFELIPLSFEEEAYVTVLDFDVPAQRALARMRDSFGLDRDELCAFPDELPKPDGSDPAVASRPEEEKPEAHPAASPSRERVRQLLENLLFRQAEICEQYHRELLREFFDGPSMYDRAAEAVPLSDSGRLMQRMQDSSFRMIWRMTNLLVKLRRPLPGPGSGGGGPEGRDNGPIDAPAAPGLIPAGGQGSGRGDAASNPPGAARSIATGGPSPAGDDLPPGPASLPLPSRSRAPAKIGYVASSPEAQKGMRVVGGGGHRSPDPLGHYPPPELRGVDGRAEPPVDHAARQETTKGR